jgi:hypothetical protein
MKVTLSPSKWAGEYSLWHDSGTDKVRQNCTPDRAESFLCQRLGHSKAPGGGQLLWLVMRVLNQQRTEMRRHAQLYASGTLGLRLSIAQSTMLIHLLN